MTKINKKHLPLYFSSAVIILLIVVFSLIESRFLNAANMANLLSDAAPLLIMAAGMTPVLLLGSIDLSVGSVCSVANVFALTILLSFQGTHWTLGTAVLVSFGLTALAAIAAGAIMGLVHVKLKIPSFIATLAFMSIWSSVALLISSAPIAIPRQLWGMVAWYDISVGPFSLPLFIALLFIVIYYVILTRTVFGRGIYAIGGNERCARIAGVPVDRVKVSVFAINAFCAALASIFLVAKAKSAAPTVGDGFTLMVIAAVVLGGTSLVGGVGNVINTIFGVFIVALISNGMNIIGVDVFWQRIVFGVILLVAVAINTDRTSRSIAVK
ncbi:MAG: ABC transporter permease [Lachnospiraceae bacterium]|nr:ABC transporter permease [Lachnospiraceae bacterium]